MLDETTANHLERVRAQTVERFTPDRVPAWITRHTMIAGRPYSFRDHEYQEKILSDTSREIVIRKCSQVGLTEATLRQSVAICAIMPYVSVIYTLPTASLASTLMTTRVDPIINESAYLSELINKNTDNASIKQLGYSYLYMKGAASGNAPISVPSDVLIHDELDFSDLGIIEQYHSRLTHSQYKWKRKFSTPTQPNYGIDAEFQESRRHFNFVKCEHCNHYFVPDYYEHVRIPGYTGELRDITKRTLPGLRWRDAAVICPSCGKSPSLQIEHRHWVCENESDNYIAAGYQVSPFDAPNIVTLADLIHASTTYNRRSQFINYNLGLPVEDSEATLLEQELRAAIVPPAVVGSASYVMGIDMGATCHVVVAAMTPDGTLLIVHCEQVHYTKITERRAELARRYWPRMTVVDAFPYTETVYRMQAQDPNLFASIYVSRKSVETHRVTDNEEERDRAIPELRQVHVNRNRAFDWLMDALRAGNVKKVTDEQDGEWVTQMRDMKRLEVFVGMGETEYVWKKSKAGNDHYHNATLYAAIASRMVGISHNRIIVPRLLGSFKIKQTERLI